MVGGKGGGFAEALFALSPDPACFLLQVQQSAAQSSNDEPQMREQGGSGPPSISLGCDDIFWMSKLHGGLMQVKHRLLALNDYE